MKNNTNLRDSTVACALLLATSPVWAGNTKTGQPPPPNVAGGGGKCQSNAFYLDTTLDNSSKQKVTSCEVPRAKLNKPRPRKKDILSWAFNPKQKQDLKLQFQTSCLPVGEGEHILVLLSSRCLANNPQINTPQSKKKLMLDTRDLQVLGIYNVPAIQPLKGNATPPATQMAFEVNLNTGLLAKQYNAGNDTFFLQAALLKKSDFEKKKYNGAILSPLEALHINPNSCPSKQEFVEDFNSPNKACKNPGKN
jgi:hypothetical protein